MNAAILHFELMVLENTQKDQKVKSFLVAEKSDKENEHLVTFSCRKKSCDKKKYDKQTKSRDKTSTSADISKYLVLSCFTLSCLQKSRQDKVLVSSADQP